MNKFTVIQKDKSSKARIGIIHTKKGPIETPFFMPVATKSAVKYIDTPYLEKIGIKALISNALILSLRPGTKIIKKMGGIGNFMNFSGVNITDSGGFQMYSPSLYIKSNEKEIIFRDPVSGKRIIMTPELNMKIQLDLGSDIAMCLDSMPLYEDSKESITQSVKKTILWAKRCKETHDSLQKNISVKKRQLLFGITQGGIYSDLRKESIKNLKELNFDGYAIGGFGLGESFNEEFKIIELSKRLLPDKKPIYLMGIGDPYEILEGIAKGCDMFDSRLPTQNARRGTLFTSQGEIKILNKKFESDKSPIDKKCSCFVCKSYSKAYVRFLLKEDEPLGKQLAGYHNIFFINDLINHTKIAIKNNSFKKLREKIRKIYSKN